LCLPVGFPSITGAREIISNNAIKMGMRVFPPNMAIGLLVGLSRVVLQVSKIETGGSS
jgi:hypothetical protein